MRRRGGGEVALIAADELNGLIETAHRPRAPRNAHRLLTALARAQGQRLDPTPLETLKRTLDGDA